MADKGMPTPSWFVGSWQAYTNPTFASLEANTDLILGIFQFFNLDPRVHNLQPLYDHAEEGELHEEAEGGEPGGKELGEPNEENLEDIPLVFKVPVNANEDVLAMQTEGDLILTQNDDNSNQEREEPDSLDLVLESDTETSLANSNSICDIGRLPHFSAAHESGAEKALSSVCLFGLSEVGSIHFSEVFHNFFSLILITNVYHKICLHMLFCQNIGPWKNFWCIFSVGICRF